MLADNLKQAIRDSLMQEFLLPKQVVKVRSKDLLLEAYCWKQ